MTINLDTLEASLTDLHVSFNIFVYPHHITFYELFEQ